MSTKLLEPLAVGSKTLKNRAAITSHSFAYGAYGNDQKPGADKYVAYVRRRMEGGVGFVGLQGIWIQGVDDRRPFAFDHVGAAFERIAGHARENGCTTVVQALHPGALLDSQVAGSSFSAVPWDGQGLEGFSAMQSEPGVEVAHELDADEIEAIIEGFGRVAELAVSSGLDGIELHAGHGYLLQQSFSPWANRRTDEWGEPLRFLKALIKRTREGLGADGILGLRMTQKDHRTVEEGGVPPERLREMAVELADTGLIDYLNPTHGSHVSDYRISIGTYRRPHGEMLNQAAALRAALGGKVPVLGVGRVTSVEHAEEALQRGDCDFIGLTRGHIADPDMFKKFASGDVDRIRPCVGANRGCIDQIGFGNDITCFHNPDVGREYRRGPLELAAEPRSVLVVGGGPAGLKAAEIAARRGHRVKLVERTDRLGGRLGTITTATRARELVGAVAWLEREVGLLGVEVLVDTPVDDRFLAAENADAVIIATGSVPVEPPFETDGSLDVLSTDEAMALVESDNKRNVLFYDTLGTEEAAVAYEQLAAAGHIVTIATPMPLGIWLGFTHMADNVPRLRALHASIKERFALRSIADKHVTMHNWVTDELVTQPFDVLVLAHSRLPNDSLRAAAKKHSQATFLVGDAYAPRDAMLAITQADAIAREV